MNKLVSFYVSILMTMSFSISAQNSSDLHATAYIADDLFIYMHAGPGTNYRIIGTIIAGTEVKLTGQADKGYTQIFDDKEREAWVETKFIAEKAGLRTMVTDLNQQLEEQLDTNKLLSEQLNSAQNQLTDVSEKLTAAEKYQSSLKKQLTEANAQLGNQDFELKKQWFFNGAIVLVVGLLFGLILPRLSPRKRSSMDNWK